MHCLLLQMYSRIAANSLNIHMHTHSGPHNKPLASATTVEFMAQCFYTHAHSTTPTKTIHALHLVSPSPVLTPFLSTFCFLQPFHQHDMPLQNTSITPGLNLAQSAPWLKLSTAQMEHLLISTGTYICMNISLQLAE